MELLQGLMSVFHWEVLLILILGCAAGISIGALPGLTATMGVALILPITFGMEAASGILLLIGVYFGSIYGGSITAILLRTPGTPSSAATAIDGYELTKKGHAQKALTMAVVASVIGGILSVILLIFVAPSLAEFALKFSAPETFALAFFGITIISSISGESLLKGLIAGFFGLLIATIGIDPMGGFPRFTFGSTDLMSGINFIPIMIGLFAAATAFESIEDIFKKSVVDFSKAVKGAKLTWIDFKYSIVTILRSSGIGAFIGMIPGAGGDIAAFVAYNEARRFSKDKDSFGKGNINGVAAPEAANNGSTGGAMIPLLTLGIPGDAVTAVMLGALMVQGLQPGPMLFTNNMGLINTLFAGMIVANLIILMFGLLGVKLFTKVLLIPKMILTPIILVLCVVGSYSLNNNMFDVWVMFTFGLIGYFMLKFGIPASPIILAIILGPLMESSFRRALTMSNGSYEIFYTRPISATLIAVGLITLISPFIKKWYTNKRSA